MTPKTKNMIMNDDSARKLAAREKARRTMLENLEARERLAESILEKGDAMTHADRLALLQLVNVAYHDSGKIEGCNSIDSTAGCEFCERMRAAAEDIILMICRYCYAAADSWKIAAWRRHQLNARIFSTVLFTVEELLTLSLEAAQCRFNEDGDTINTCMARNYLRIARGRPETMFGYWYKNSSAVESGLHAEGIHTRADLPQNVRFIHSSALIGFPARPNWFDDAIFTVYPDAATTAAAVAAGAHECNGRRCRACGFFCYCMERQPEPVNIAEYLRCGKAQRAAVMEAYDARKLQEAAAPQA